LTRHPDACEVDGGAELCLHAAGGRVVAEALAERDVAQDHARSERDHRGAVRALDGRALELEGATRVDEHAHAGDPRDRLAAHLANDDRAAAHLAAAAHQDGHEVGLGDHDAEGGHRGVSAFDPEPRPGARDREVPKARAPARDRDDACRSDDPIGREPGLAGAGAPERDALREHDRLLERAPRQGHDVAGSRGLDPLADRAEGYRDAALSAWACPGAHVPDHGARGQVGREVVGGAGRPDGRAARVAGEVGFVLVAVLGAATRVGRAGDDVAGDLGPAGRARCEPRRFGRRGGQGARVELGRRRIHGGVESGHGRVLLRAACKVEQEDTKDGRDVDQTNRASAADRDVLTQHRRRPHRTALELRSGTPRRSR
jgi:hypothetical protein